MTLTIYIFCFLLWYWHLIRRVQKRGNHSAVLQCLIKATSPHKNATDVSTKKREKAAITLFAVCGGFLFAPLFPSLIILDTLPLPDFLKVYTELTDYREWFRITLITVSVGIGILVCVLFMLMKEEFWQKPVFKLICFSGFGLFLSSLFLVRELNILLDTNPPVIDERPFISKYCSIKCQYRSDRQPGEFKMTAEECLKENRELAAKRKIEEIFDGILSFCKKQAWISYSIVVPHWKNTDENYIVDVQPLVYDYAREGDFISIPKHQGAFGIEWLKHGELQYIGATYSKNHAPEAD